MAADNWKTDKEPSVRVAVALSYKIDSCKGVTSPDLASHSLEGPAPPSEALQGRAGWSFGGWGWLLPEFVCSRLNFIIFVSFFLFFSESSQGFVNFIKLLKEQALC